MRRRLRYSKKRLTYVVVLLLIALVSVGYAAISSTLSITGVTKVKGSTWNIYYDNVVVKEGSVTANLPQITDDTALSYSVTLNEPGNFYEFTVDVVNAGTLNAQIDKITKDDLTDDQKKFLSYSLTYVDGSEVKLGDLLNSGATKTLKVRVEYLENINSSDLPENDVTLNLSLKTEYVQVGADVVEDQVVVGPVQDLLVQRVWAGKTSYVINESHNQRVTMKEPLAFKAGDTITIKGTGDSNTWFGFFLLNNDEPRGTGTYSIDTGCSSSMFGLGSWSNGYCDSGWINTSVDRVITIPKDTYVVMNFGFGSGRNTSTTEEHAEAVRNLVTFSRTVSGSSSSSTPEVSDDANEFGTYANLTQKLLADNITVTTYDKGKLVTIPSNLSNGAKIVPHVALTASTVGGTDIKSAYTFANNNNLAAVINAGLFNTSTKQPQGQTIIKGVSVTNSPMTTDMGAALSSDECYPLLITNNGYLSAASSRQVDTADLINAGAYYSVTGWMSIIDNGVKKYSDYNAVEIVHKNSYERQIIGQYVDGDYFVFTTNTSNKAGMTYDAIADYLLSLSKKVRFAYSLDGGGSTESIIDKQFINYIYENSPKGRSIPSVIYFDVAS